MKSLRLLLVLICPALLFWGCSKEKSFEVGNGSTTQEWEFNEGSNFFKGKVDTAYKTEISAGVTAMLLEGTSDDGTGTLTLGILGLNPSAPGTYQTPQVLFDYSKGTGTVYQNDIAATGQFTIEVTKIDSASISGVFTGKAKDSTGTLKTITSGKFSARFGAGTPQSGTSQLTFWSKTGCGSGGTGPISVKLSNAQTGSISAFTASAPACGAAGTASFTVPSGTYGYEAVCGTDTVRGVVTAAANQCLRQEVVFGSTPANGQVIFWAKSGCNGNPINLKFNNQNGTITNFTGSAPATCTATGNPSYTVAPGVYTWQAICGNDTVSATVTVQANTCSKVEVSLPTGPNAQYSLVSSAGTCSNYQVHGTYFAGRAVSPDTNTVVVQVNVTQVGAYTVSTNTVNGYSFFASGVFTSTGVQNVTMKGQGTPVATGSNNFTVTAGSSTCSFPITVQQLPPNATLNTWSFTQGTRNFSGLFPTNAIFGDDVFGLGKAIYMSGEVPNTDSVMDLYIQFPASATQPIPGTYITDPNIFSSNTTDWYMYDASSGDDIFYIKDVPTGPTPPNVKLTIIITSYDAANKIIKGTFSGTAWNAAGTIVNITNGKFEAAVDF